MVVPTKLIWIFSVYALCFNSCDLVRTGIVTSWNRWSLQLVYGLCCLCTLKWIFRWESLALRETEPGGVRMRKSPLSVLTNSRHAGEGFNYGGVRMFCILFQYDCPKCLALRRGKREYHVKGSRAATCALCSWRVPSTLFQNFPGLGTYNTTCRIRFL